MSARHIIIDSSVAIKWYLPDEYDDEALKIKADFASRKILIAVPALFFYEISNILRTASKSLRIAKKDSVEVYQDLLELNFMIYSSKELFTAALSTALEQDITSYDASYVVLAQYLQVPFYTADAKLLRSVAGELVRSLKDYKG